MTAVALALVLTSAVFHASWNLLAKRANGGIAFVWLFSVMMFIFYAPVAIATIFIEKPPIGGIEIVFIMGTAILHIGYFLMLTWGYQRGDLSLVYPVARGSGPMLATVGAILLLGERPTPLILFGVICIGLGVFIFADGFAKFRDPEARSGLNFALSVGAIIATYTLWDKYAVDTLDIPPTLYEWAADFIRIPVLTVLVWRNREEIRFEWENHRREAIGIAILSPLAYIMVLTALSFTDVSYVAPLREISIIIGAAMGTKLLAEGQATRRWSAAAIVAIGVVCLSLG
jgi:drug/metabolite transporter (DMT)-like permease